MKLQLAPSLTFKGNIIDSHAHLGEWHGDNNYQSNSLNGIAQDTFETTINGQKQTNEIECFLVSNLSCMYQKQDGKFVKDEIEGNKDLLKIAEQNPKIKVELACEPTAGSAEKIEAMLKEHSPNVYALKFHPMCSNLSADDPRYEPYMKVAQRFQKPCVFHSDRIDTNASPRKIYELAKKTPDVPVVLYHMSMASPARNIEPISHLSQEELTAQGLDDVGKINGFQWNNRERWNQDGIDVVKESIAKKDADLYLETSWTKPETVVKAIKEVGEDRVLFGTDAPFDGKEKYIQYVTDVKTAIKNEFGEKSEAIINKVFFENANKLFFNGKLQMRIGEQIPTQPKIENSPSLQSSSVKPTKSKILPIVLGLLALGGLAALGFSKTKKNNDI